MLKRRQKKPPNGAAKSARQPRGLSGSSDSENYFSWVACFTASLPSPMAA
jgi:hypothetical protein